MSADGVFAGKAAISQNHRLPTAVVAGSMRMLPLLAPFMLPFVLAAGLRDWM